MLDILFINSLFLELKKTTNDIKYHNVLTKIIAKFRKINWLYSNHNCGNLHADYIHAVSHNILNFHYSLWQETKAL